jgi:hypothetical protein
VRLVAHRVFGDARVVSRLLPWFLVCVTAAAASAQGVGVPSSRWGVGFGNSPEFTGLLGLVNIVRDNPAPLKVLPLFNTSF